MRLTEYLDFLNREIPPINPSEVYSHIVVTPELMEERKAYRHGLKKADNQSDLFENNA